MPKSTKLNMLKEQYSFLKRSIDAVMEGHEEEALRIATTVRVLVHETASSTPLLKQIDPNYRQLTILDIPPPKPTRPGGQVLFYVGVGVSVNSATGLHPIIDLKNPPPGQQLVSLDNWWSQIILMFMDAGQRVVFTRKQFILTLANKEGRSHVDTTLPANYEKFVVESPLKFMVNGIQTDAIHLARYTAVRAAAQLCECLETQFP